MSKDKRSFPGGYAKTDLRRIQATARAKKQWNDPKKKAARRKAIKAGLEKAKQRRAAMGIAETIKGA
jgi:hypothetical protein